MKQKKRRIRIPKNYRVFLAFLAVVWAISCIWAAIPEVPNNLALDRIERRVIELRELDSNDEVRRVVVSHKEWDAIQVQSLQAYIDPDTESEIRDGVLTLRAFDMLERAVPARQVLTQWYTNLRGTFSLESGVIFIVSNDIFLGPAEELVFAHEFTHALQDQNLGLAPSSPFLLDDTLLAARALMEGDAKLVEQMYREKYLSDEDIASLEEQVAERSTTSAEELEIIDTLISFPYRYGPGLVGSLYEQGGWATVNAAYSNPPQTTEHILHPDRYLMGEQPQVVDLPVLSDVLGVGWRQVGAGILGEYLTAYYLCQHVSDESATTAAEGWGGDRYKVYHNSSNAASVLVLRTVWDTAFDREEFVSAYNAYADARSGSHSATRGDAITCWSGEKDYLCLIWDTDSTTVVLSPDESITDLILRELDQ